MKPKKVRTAPAKAKIAGFLELVLDDEDRDDGEDQARQDRAVAEDGSPS